MDRPSHTPETFEKKVIPKIIAKFKELTEQFEALEKKECGCDRMTCYRCLNLDDIRRRLDSMCCP